MIISDIFEVGEIMEMEDKDKSIAKLSGDNCEITGKILNKQKIILHMKRGSDSSEGNVFVRLIGGNREHFPISKRLLASRSIIGLTLNQFRSLDVEGL